MLSLGINFMHDAAAAIVHDGVVIAAAEEERFVRKKHVSGFPVHAIRYCLDQAGAGMADVDHVGVAWRYWVLGRRALQALKAASSPAMFMAKLNRGAGQMTHEWYQMFRVRSLIEQHVGKGRFELTSLDHHTCHAASSFYPSPFERAAILTVDGAGESATTVLAMGEGDRITEIRRILLPHSLGQFYAAVTGYLGFQMQSDEYKVMGLASYGAPRYQEWIEREILLKRDGGAFVLNHHLLDYHLARRGSFAPSLVDIWGPPRRPDEPVEQRHMDIAASAQAALEGVLFHLLAALYDQTKVEQLCLAGGVGFNCVANGKMLQSTPFRDIFVQPAAGDAGTALGAALYLDQHTAGRPTRYQMTDAYLGPSASDAEVRRAVDAFHLQAEPLSEDELCRRTAALLADGGLVFWFQGRMEWGPRALGNRSLLADPRREGIRDVVNLKVKQREAFRPFAPSVLEERSGEFFDTPGASPFMLFTFPVKKDKRHLVPAITHVDGTARPQTVARSTNPRYWKLIRSFDALTGVPMLLNTSFNVQEPIVCTPEDAVKCFLRTDVDALVMNDLWISRPTGNRDSRTDVNSYMDVGHD